MTGTAERSAKAIERPGFADLLSGWQARIEQELSARLPGVEAPPLRLHEALRYSVLGGGKRVRPALVYGPAQSERFFVPALIRACLAGRDFEMTSGEQVRELLYVDDLVDVLLRAAESSELAGQVLNLGGGEPLRVVELARRIQRLCGRGALRIGARPARATEIERFQCDSSRAAEVLDWRAL